ncbi:MAG: hypothetical protein ACFCUT_06775 [Kiloniellaceae bacterium]
MDRSKLFKAAWIAARRGAATFGGSPRQYFRLALVYAWEAAKAPKPAAHDWHERRPAPCLTQEQRDRIRVQTEADLSKVIALAKAAGIARGRSHAGAWMGR